VRPRLRSLCEGRNLNPQECSLCPRKSCCQTYSAFLLGYNTLLIQHQPDAKIALGLSVDIGGQSIGTIELARLLPDGTMILGVKREFVDALLEVKCPE
jgi:hypothetical protein